METDNVERPGDAREEAMALQLSGATRKAPAVTTIQVVLLMWIAGVFLWMRWFWVHEAVFPHVARAIAGGKEDVEPRVLLWALVVPFVLLGITVKSAQRASVWELRRSSAFVWLQNSSLRRTLGIDPVDAVAFAVFAILQLNCLFGKLYIDRRSGKLAKSGYIKCTAKALGLNGLVTMVLALVLMARQSFPLKLVNISSERASRYHVWLGQYTVLALGLHGALYCIVWIQTDRMPGVIMPCIDCSAKESYKSFRNFSGLAGYIALLIVACASIERVRRMHFQWFSIIHTLNVAFIVLTCNHYAPAVIWLTPALLIYSLYRAISLFTRNRVQVMGAKALSPEVLQLTLRRAHAASNSVDFSPGQYVYLKVPAISNRQWHPFSISSSPLRDRNSFQIDAKVEGPFTQALRHRIQTDSVGEIVVDGFYGSSIHPCAHMIFVAGGSGITPFLSMLEHLWAEPQERAEAEKASARARANDKAPSTHGRDANAPAADSSSRDSGHDMDAENAAQPDSGACVWVPHDDQVWKRAVVLRRMDDGGSAEVRLEPNEGTEHRDDGLVKVVNIKDIARMAGEVSELAMPMCNTFSSMGVDDMCTLNHLHEPAVLRNLEIRFARQMPYTYTGQICIAVNPYQWLDLYGTHLYEQYLNEPRDSLPPHPFALSATSYMDMKRSQMDQSILVSGESGAGKTETVKIMMNHLASISGGGDRGTVVINQVLKSNPLLESFGNAKTKRNDNSSRFGKFAQLQFDVVGSLVGARCETYLLEKSRVVGQADGERNYHIFYQIFRLAEERKASLRLKGDVTNYRYVRVGANAELSGIDDDQCLRETLEAMDIIGITRDEQDAIFELVSAILNLGEANFIQGVSEEKSSVSNEDIVESVAALLQTDIKALRSTLLERSITAGTESYTIPLNSEQASDLRDALAKGMYTQMFDWLVARINKAICSTRNVRTHIGLLDIFGFESFETNGFEQLCINYANEKLQQKFNSDVFKVVQQEYVEEEIPLELVTFEDNQPILDLIEGRMGIVSLLNEEVLRPQASDNTFVSKVLDAHGDHPHVEKSKFNQMLFMIRHYAGDVTYNGTGFLEKNKDTLPTDMIQLLSGSSSKVIASIFTPTEVVDRKSGGNRNGRRQQGFLVGNTIAGAFRKQLSELMETINKTASQYVRCIKPNSNKSASEFDRQMIVEQLRCAGVIAAIRISRAAFPNRLPLIEFQQRFQIICPSSLRDATPEDMVAGLLRELLPGIENVKNTKFAVGRTKVYFSSGLLQQLEDRRNSILKAHALMIQKAVRGFVHRKRFLKMRVAAVRAQAIIRRGLLARRFQKLRTGAIKLQALQRGRRQRHAFAILVEKVRREREMERRRQLELQRQREQEAEAERLRQSAPEPAHDAPVIDDYDDPHPEPVEDEWSDVGDKLVDVSGPVSPKTLQALTTAAAKVAEAEAAARDAQQAAVAALELNRDLQAQNDRLRATLSSNVAEYADAELLRENERLKQQVAQLQNKLVRSQEVSLISAKVVDSRITYREGRQFVEYKLQIETNTRGTLYVWHRYSTFRNLAATLQTKNGYKRKEIPELPNKQLFGNFSEKIIQERVAKLNQFLEAATNAEYLQWGIRVDQDTCVYKRRVKNPSSRDSVVSTISTANSSPRASSRLSMKSFSFRRGSTSSN
ncbi:TPA: hypothetical protein N0F65_004509 [Lagenidium giganteum]|uniref:Uncharacterized protein n=1 Tax=Lagenidium giganteum TaxID=4803 RepID=A0AAV2YX65_9STRA|nr:TPA: hypothetical protein N0F65_004509 [Lagenidium giganteum]